MAPKRTALIAACVIAASLAGAPANAASDGFWIGGPAGADAGFGGISAPRGGREVEVGKGGGYRFSSIGDAVKAVGAGGIVRVQPGIYVESLKITKPVTIVGLVNRPNENLVKIQAPADAPCVFVDVSGSGFVSLRQIDMVAGQQNVQRSCVELESGYLSIKDSTIAAPNYVSTVLARGGHLSLETTTVSGGREGVLITARDGTGTYYIVSSKIAGNITGIKVDGLAQANIVGNDITQNAAGGIVYYQGRGSVIGNDIHHNMGAGLVLQNSPQSPTVKANKIYENTGNGIQIVPAVAAVGTPGRPMLESKGLICDNMITNNFGAGIDAMASGMMIECSNELHGNRGDKGGKRRGIFGN